MKKLILYSILIIFGQNIQSQISRGGIPESTLQNLNWEKVPLYISPRLDLKVIQLDDEKDKKNLMLPRFGVKDKVKLSLNNSGLWDILANGDKIWRLRIKCENALSLNFIFEKYYLSPGSKLYIYSTDKRLITGAFTNSNNRGTLSAPKALATTPIIGNNVIIELYQPNQNYNKDVLEISEIINGYRYLQTSSTAKNINRLKAFNDNKNHCMVNVNCPEGNNWQDEKTGVALIVVDGNRQASGSLINNVKNDGRLLFLTANHVYNNHPDLSKWSFIWGYESSGCNTPNLEPSTSNSTSGGATLRARIDWLESDFALVELEESPYDLNPPYRAFFNGWSRKTSLPSGGVGIHHPWADIKKISTYTQTPATATCISGHYWNINWVSTTNGHSVVHNGSSGSPLFSSNHLIIGQLYGACTPDEACDDPSGQNALYGKLSHSWNYTANSSPINRLKDWLDPDQSDALEQGGGYLEACQYDVTVNTSQNGKKTYLASNNIYASSAINSNVQVNMEAGNSVIISDGFHAKNSSDFTAKIMNCVPRVILKMANLVQYSNSSNQQIKPSFTIYPNPTKDNTVLKLDNVQKGIIEIMVRDIQGKVIAKLDQIVENDGSYQANLDVSNYIQGIYMVSIKIKEYQETLKLKIEK